MSRAFWFQAVAVFLFNLGVSSVISDAGALFDRPVSYTGRLVNNVPITAPFFVSYIFVRALLENATLLLRIPDLLVYLATRAIKSTDRARARMLSSLSYVLYPIYIYICVCVCVCVYVYLPTHQHI